MEGVGNCGVGMGKCVGVCGRCREVWGEVWKSVWGECGG